MDLKTYAQKKGGTGKRWCPVLADIAKAVECSAETMYMYAGGHKKPSALKAIAISDATNGIVTRRELRPDVFGPAPKRRAA